MSLLSRTSTHNAVLRIVRPGCEWTLGRTGRVGKSDADSQDEGPDMGMGATDNAEAGGGVSGLD